VEVEVVLLLTTTRPLLTLLSPPESVSTAVEMVPSSEPGAESLFVLARQTQMLLVLQWANPVSMAKVVVVELV
jgi:hypothetical protein